MGCIFMNLKSDHSFSFVPSLIATTVPSKSINICRVYSDTNPLYPPTIFPHCSITDGKRCSKFARRQEANMICCCCYANIISNILWQWLIFKFVRCFVYAILRKCLMILSVICRMQYGFIIIDTVFVYEMFYILSAVYFIYNFICDYFMHMYE